MKYLKLFENFNDIESESSYLMEDIEDCCLELTQNEINLFLL